jgi:L-tyrosine isonitrile synthase
MKHEQDLAMANNILNAIFKRRKLLETEDYFDDIEVCDLPKDETELHIHKIQEMIKNNEPIKMVLPAFPGKSPNRNKTLSKLPDLAEKNSIDNLNKLCKEIAEIYPHGVSMIICSDGYVFSDLVRIPDEDVSTYTESIRDYYQENYPGHFEYYDIIDAYPELKSLDAAREELLVCHGESLIRLTEKANTDKEILSMYRGISKFLYEDFSGIKEFDGLSNTQIQKAAKSTALRVIQRSNAWGELLETTFPNALRLSIHPQFRVSKKIGITMSKTSDCWRTPWHSVAIKKNDEIYLEKRCEINEDTHRLIFNQGMPCHYKMIPASRESFTNV